MNEKENARRDAFRCETIRFLYQTYHAILIGMAVYLFCRDRIFFLLQTNWNTEADKILTKNR